MYSSSSWNFLGLDNTEISFKDANFVIIPIPYDSTASYRMGSRNGPHSIINASRNLELFDTELETEPYIKGIYTLNEVNPIRGNVRKTLDKITHITTDLLQKNKIPILIGGEHTITLGAVTAFPDDVMVVDLDAHSDLRDTYLGDYFCHASVMRRLIDQGRDIVEIGIRSMSIEEFQFAKQTNLPIFSRNTLRRRYDEVIDEIKHLINGRRIYLTIDIDVIDPSEAPGVSTPEPDGLSFHEVTKLLRMICTSSTILSFDVVEVTPIHGNVITEFLAAKLIYKTLGYISSN